MVYVVAVTADLCVCMIIDCSVCAMHAIHEGVVDVVKTLPWSLITFDLHLL